MLSLAANVKELSHLIIRISLQNRAGLSMVFLALPIGSNGMELVFELENFRPYLSLYF